MNYIDCETYKIFKQFKDKQKQDVKHEILSNNIMNKYMQKPIQEWIDEGINYETQKKFQVRFDDKNNRIVFPIQDEEGNIISIKGRTCYKNYKELGISKYIHYYSFGANDILYGLNINKEQIQKQNEVIVFEAEKSVMKAYSMGIYNTVAVGTHTINPYQVEKLLKLYCNIVIAFDKDVTYKELKNEANKLNKFTNVSFIYDKNNLLGEKDSPIDKGLGVFLELYESRVRI